MLYGHDAPNMKQFALHFEHIAENDSLDRRWFGEVWFPVVKPVLGAQYAWSSDTIIDPQDLHLQPKSQKLIFAFRGHKLRFEIPPMPSWKAEPPMCCYQRTCLLREHERLRSQSTWQLVKRRSNVGAVKYMHKTVHVRCRLLVVWPTFLTCSFHGRTVAP